LLRFARNDSLPKSLASIADDALRRAFPPAICGRAGRRRQLSYVTGGFRARSVRLRFAPLEEAEKRMKTSVLILSCLMFAGPALAATTEGPGAKESRNLSPASADFVKQAAIANRFEIESGQLAQSKGDPSDKTFAEHIIRDHQKNYSALKDIDPNAPNSIDAAHRKLLDELGELNGAAFSKQFRSDQIKGHEQTLALFRRYAETGDNDELKRFAAQSLPTLEHHLQMADQLR
jgi:putative membrane protein